MKVVSWRDLGARPLFFPSLFLLLGVASWRSTAPPWPWFWSAAGLCFALSWALDRRAGAHVLLLLALFALGLGLASLEARTQVPPPLLTSSPAVLEGQVEQTEEAGPQQPARLLLQVSRVLHPVSAEVRFRVWLYAPEAPLLFPGQRLRLTAQLKPWEPPLNPGQVDLRLLRWRQATPFTGSFQGASVVLLTPASAFRRWLAAVHARLAQQVFALAPSREAAALYLTLAAGQRAQLSEDVEEAFSKSGLAHVLSVSGLHVAALALMALAALRWLLVRGSHGFRDQEARRWAAPAVIPLTWAYVSFTGNQAPALRSAVMASVVLLGLGLWRRAEGLNSLAVAAALLVAWQPSSVGELSLQLSFLAVASLLLLSPVLEGMWEAEPLSPQALSSWSPRVWHRAKQNIWQTLCASVAVTLASLPLVISVFGRLSLAGLLANIVCLPLSGLLTGLAAGGAALFTLWPPLALPVLWAGAWASQLLLGVAQAFASLPGATLSLPALSVTATALYALGLIFGTLGTERWRWAFSLCPLALLLTAFAPHFSAEPGLTVSFLSVGQGDAIVLSSRGQHALVDGGGVPQGKDTGHRYVVPFLRQARIEQLALAVLSHPHPDHALGLASTLRQIPTQYLWLAEGSVEGPLSRSVTQAAGPARVQAVAAGHPPFQLGEASLHVLGPPKAPLLPLSVNDGSVVLELRHGKVRMWLTGDVEAEGEAALLSQARPLDVLKAPHHGSRTSSSLPLLQKLKPRQVIFCVGRQNRFGFPHPEVVQRYAQAGAHCYRTDLEGTVTVESDGESVQVRTFRPHPEGRQGGASCGHAGASPLWEP